MITGHIFLCIRFSTHTSYLCLMADVHEPEIRSYNMSRIKGKNTKPELIVRKFLFANGFRYRLHDKKLPGKPDIILKKYNTVIFVNGCFWHGHERCKYFRLPSTNPEWWEKKINDTKERDRKYHDKLIKDGWNVIVLWECQLKKNTAESTLKSLLETLTNNKV